MKKRTCLGVLLLVSLCVGCGQQEVALEKVDEGNAVESEIPEEHVEPLKIENLTSEDITPFFEALYSYSEEEFSRLNRNDDVAYGGYFEDLTYYKEKMDQVLGAYFSKALKKQLKEENIRLAFDLPKKTAIDDYVVDAKGKIVDVAIQASRPMGDHMIYEVAVTSSNGVMSRTEFRKRYGWSQALGYYAQEGEASVREMTYDQIESPSYAYASPTSGQDEMKVVSHYWLEVSEPESSSQLCYQVEGLKEAGNYEVDDNSKQRIDNAQYMERVPYYEGASDRQKKGIIDLMTKLLNARPETYRYYEKVFQCSFEMYQHFWMDLGTDEEMNLNAETFQEAFPITINPYKDAVIQLKIDSKAIRLTPSLYSTAKQANFVVSIPAEALLNDNSTEYYDYKYFVSTENDKVEAVQFMKIDELTEEAFKERINEDQDQGSEAENEETNPPQSIETKDEMASGE